MSIIAHDWPKWPLLVPGRSIFYLFEVAGRTQGEAYLMFILFIIFPLGAGMMVTLLGWSLMAKTGRSKVAGLMLTLPPWGFVGLPLIAFTARGLSS